MDVELLGWAGLGWAGQGRAGQTEKSTLPPPRR